MAFKFTHRHGSQNDKSELPTMNKSIDDADQEDGDEKYENPNFFTDSFLQFVQISEIELGL